MIFNNILIYVYKFILKFNMEKNDLDFKIGDDSNIEQIIYDINYLKNKNKHERDNNIQFEEKDHVYIINGIRGGYMSTTTFIHTLFPKFNTDDIINKIINSKNWNNDPEYKYYKMSKEDILNMWNKNRDTAASSGTNMHADIEKYYNKVKVNNDSIEFQYFLQYVKDNCHLKPYRTEWTVYYEEYKISGSIDMTYENEDGTLDIYDWKRCKEILYDNNFSKNSILECLKHIPDTNFWHYSIQLNIYKKILEDKYNKKIKSLCLVCLHPNNDKYEIIEVPILTNEINNIFEYRKNQLK